MLIFSTDQAQKSYAVSSNDEKHPLFLFLRVLCMRARLARDHGVSYQ